MRHSTMFFLAFGLTALPAFAQNAGTWSNTDPGCDDSIYTGTVEQVQRQQEDAARDADAVNDYLKKIKEGPRNASDKLLSCVDVAWPDLPFSGVLPGIEEYIKNVGDKAVEKYCNEMRDQVRQVDSVFSMPDLKMPSLGTPKIAGVSSQSVGGLIPSAPATGAQSPNTTGDSGAFGGLIDLIKPKPSGSGNKP